MTAKKITTTPQMHGIGCRKCGVCGTNTFCTPFRGKLRQYDGSRFTADGFDCAFPVALDGHSTCSFRCLYCFSNYLMRDPNRKAAGSLQVKNAYRVGQYPISHLDAMIGGKGKPGSKERRFYDALHSVSEDKRVCPVQWGALGDPFDNIERQQGWGLQAMPVFEKYDQPVRISTKGGAVLLEPEYLRAFSRRPELYWIAWSLISIDDSVLSQIDKDAPPPSVRLRAMKELTKLGVSQSLRFRPILPAVSDATKKYPFAWRDLIRASAEAGCKAVSMEFAFVPGAMPDHVKRMWNEIMRVTGVPLVDWYKQTTSIFGACLRSSRAWKEDLTFAILEETHRLGMTFAISDPHWKELNDYGCCCGVSPDDPIFGGWQRKNATNALLLAKSGKRISAKDGIPNWASLVRMDEMVCMTGVNHAYRRANECWSDKLRDTWNDLESPRGPLHYFEGALVPVGREKNGDVIYEYREPKRRKRSLDVPFLRVRG